MALALLLLLLPPLLLTPAAEIAGGRDGQHPSLSVISIQTEASASRSWGHRG
jgi:hypothetical protein